MATLGDALLTAKLSAPPAKQNLVSRPRLTALLHEGLARRLTLISAPAGYGKTTLVGDWIHALARAPISCMAGVGRGVRVAWLSLDEADNDPTRFTLHLVTAPVWR